MKPYVVFIVGYPRTATTGIYQEICRYLGELGFKPLCIYEPFNPDVVDDIYRRGIHEHDRVGEIIHTYDLLPPQLFEEIRLNARWLDGFMYGRKPYLGDWKAILDKLYWYAEKTGRALVIKDVYVWPRLGQLKRLYGDKTVFISPIRHRDYVFRSLRRWMDQRMNVKLVPHGIGLSKLRPRKILGYLRYYTWVSTLLLAEQTRGRCKQHVWASVFLQILLWSHTG
ncbi:MAG: hypothetical protein GXO43_04235 [Crenarchaeota archaeon]|nr:hypothetical protein [Thermoproteota archaeon]